MRLAPLQGGQSLLLRQCESMMSTYFEITY
jgi:hypothetical protein